MNRTTSLTIAALVAASLAAGTAAPALAQDQGPRARMQMQFDGPAGERGPGQHRRDGMGGGLFALVCSDRGADRLEHMLLSIAQRTDPTADQQPLYDAFKAAATAAQADFAAVCEANKPADGAAPTADLADRLGTRLKIDEARVAAMSDVLPAFEAFYDSLTDDQKAALQPQREHHRMFGERDGKPGARRGSPAIEAPEQQG